MKTRMELWKDYRNEIEQNIALHEAVRQSDDRFKLLEGRLLKSFPNYYEKFSSALSVFKVKVEKNATAEQFDERVLEELLDTLKSSDDESSDAFSAIDSMSFSDGTLDDVIKELKKGKINNIEYYNPTNSVGLEVTSLHKVNLGGKMRKYRIAIDGPSGSGKSTVARLVAQRHGYIYINTGLIYRAIALNVLKSGIDVESQKKELVQSLQECKIELLPNEVVLLQGKNVTKDVRSDIVSQTASKVAAIPEVRSYALKLSQNYAVVPGTVMDGRDTTFKIMPTADLKIFLDTKADVRAQRRVEQNRILGFDTNYDSILKEIKERDNRDRTRAVDPLHQTSDAHLIDASDMSIEEVVATIEDLIKKL